MDLKELLGEELYKQVIEKAGDKHKIAVVSDGNWFPKEKFDQVNQEKNDYKQQVSDRDTQLAELGEKAKGNEKLQAEIDRLKSENETAKNEYQDKLDKQSFDFALKDAIAANKARNPKAIQALLDMNSIKLDGEQLLGLNDQIAALKESDPYLFETDDSNPQNTPQIVVPGNPDGSNNSNSPDPFAAKLAKYKKE